MKRYAAITLIAMVMLVGCARQSGSGSYTIRVTTSSWSGWVSDYVPEENTYSYTVTSPGVLHVPPEGEFTLNITGMDTNSITFETQHPMSPYGDTINLATDLTVFTVYRGHTISLVTPSTDCGNVYIIEFVELP